MRKSLGQFSEAKKEYLNPPASQLEIIDAINALGEGLRPILAIHEVFNGEITWGAFLPAYRLLSLTDISELVAAYSYVSEMLEEDELDPSSGFVPFISTDVKSEIGLLNNPLSLLDKCVVEYDAERGTFLLWSKSIDQFIDAFFSLSATISVTSMVESNERFRFSAQQITSLSKWPDIVYPVIDTTETDFREFIR